MAGFKTNEIISAMPGLLDLASAAGSDLGVTSDIVSDALTAFGLKAKDTSHLADVMAKASSTANTNVEMLGEAYKYAAAPAHAFGMSAEEVTAALAKMADAGVKGTMGGTALRGALTRLAKPPKQAAVWLKKLGVSIADTHGKIRPFNSIMGDMRKSMSKLTQQQKQQAVASIFGQEAMSGMLAVLNTSTEDFEKYTQSLKKADGTAKEMAKTKLDSLGGQFTILKSAVEGMQIELGERLAPYAKQFVTWFTGKIPDITNGIVNIVDKISHLASEFNKLSPATKKFIGFLALGTLTIGPFIRGIKSIISLGSGLKTFFSLFKGATTIAAAAEGVGAATTAMGTATATATGATVASSGALGTLGASLGAISAPVAIAIAAIAALGYGGYKLKKYLESDAVPAIDLFADATKTVAYNCKSANGTIIKSYGQTSIKISDATKKAVGAYMELDKQATKSLIQLRTNTNVFSKQSKNKVLKNFLDMSKKSSNINSEMKNSMITDFKNLVSTTGVLTDTNKTNMIKKYRDMVNGCSKLTNKQKQDTISNFTNMLNGINAATQDQKNKFMKIYSQMGNEITQSIDKKKNEQLNSLKDLFSKSNVLSSKEEADILKKTDEAWNKKKGAIDNCQKQIDAIWQNAIQNHRQLSNEELQQIDNYKEQMKTSAIKHLSEQEVESNIILERMKGSNERITAEIASENIKKLNEQRDSAVKIANEECNQRIGEIIKLRDESHIITDEQAELLIKDSIRQRDGLVKSAEETRSQAVEQITSMDSTISKDVNTTTGEVISNSQRMQSTWDNWNPKEHNCVVNFFHNIFTSKKETSDPKKQMTTEEFLKMKEQGYATGTNYATSGIHEVAEHGFEIVIGRQKKLFNGGEKVLNHRKSKQFLETTNDEIPQEKSRPHFDIAKPQLAIGGGGNTSINVDVNNEFNNEADIDKIVEESAKQFAYKLKQSLKNIKK
ncbi:phage tail tape measure protein [Clostridium botulinum C]|uniref:Phage tail tape measure protein n=2 Tax=Clostridium botulinum TaxID=1491 RepID=A0A9Q4TNW3_CLOBO|nr:phage tail tape measure protein [Clostridium botulinum]MCD3195694.1 phage tail tape measure protein [Clostridium botulinum C]MCD3201110.1 phage tail tape measure protein [Clostridium botulinum C]MCD3206638.1 phage tail tape measure protein [Clostridium botulinum C]MCD3209363.1 phage tail tape measure protein [Clostridium botulinum C]MCD3226495.1 phage tail tape measure protein [Clostridium botulinum C]